MTVHGVPERRLIKIFDTTLRDGEQAPGNAMSPHQKLEIALVLEELGVNVIETGFPSSSMNDQRATAMIAKALTTAEFSTLNRATRSDISIAAEAGGTDRHHLQVMVTGSDIHLEHKRGISRGESLAEVRDSLRFARTLGFTKISLGIEDATRGSGDLLQPLIETGLEEGATTVVLADTTGCMVPSEFGALIGRARRWVPEGIGLSTHCHDDMGLSLANALAGIAAGADEVQVTLAGIGERAGNTALEELAAVLLYKGDEIRATSTLRTEGLYEAYKLLSRVIGLQPSRNKALFGENAFATLAGIHQAGMLRTPVNYEYVEPHRFGRQREMLVGRHSGHNVVRYAFEQLGLPVDESDVRRIYADQIADRTGGQTLTLDGLKALILQESVVSREPGAVEVTS
ncbi:LeuA family protein [Micromonospora siamensis]|uniref:2-isopropylmalate synthase n=2 Tax=Micromonospora siamensis TaxID=299152 RepID=A0A1C5HG69_9ACTN|nr:pyruvate carboxyltransferase [Micromonospora siamensis]SCG44501.1 2-isopropylmalate synthase [Micromonospora siamensis]